MIKARSNVEYFKTKMCILKRKFNNTAKIKMIPFKKKKN